ncbi:MAG: potassium channel family protein [Campylobacterota bacterium]
MQNSVYLFGYGTTGSQLVTRMKHIDNITVIDNTKQHILSAKEKTNLNACHIDITSDREIEKINIQQDSSVAICAMDEEGLNIFLVLSLKALYPRLQIVAISDSLEMNQKLSIAGADKVIDIYEPGANRIYNILEKPYVLKVFDKLFNPNSKISFREFSLGKDSEFIGKKQTDLNLSEYNLILVGIMDSQKKEHFTFTTHGNDHLLNVGDILVCMGKDNDLEKFYQYMKDL